MKKVLVGIFCLFVSFLSAEVLEDVEYSLPKEAQDWKVANKIENENGATIIYIPKDSDNELISEYFGVNSNHFKFSGNEVESIKEGLSTFFPNMEIDVKQIEKSNESFLYEWSVKENSEDKVHGWGRVFVKPDGTAILNFQTEDIANVPGKRSIWLPAIKEAKIKANQ